MSIGEEAWRSHAELVGRVTLAWNAATMQLLRVFCHLTGLGSPLADALFFSHKSDRAQRGLIKAVGTISDLKASDLKTLVSILKDLDGVAVGRNLAAHTIFSISLFDGETGAWGPRVVHGLTPPQDARLNEDFSAQFAQVEQDLAVLHQRLEHWLVHTPFPERQWSGAPFLGPPPGG